MPGTKASGGATKFKPGQSGNPGGKPRTAAEVVLFARDRSMAAMQVLEEVMLDKKESGSVRVAAANSFLDRAWGKPSQAVSIKDPVEDLSDAELLALMADAVKAAKKKK